MATQAASADINTLDGVRTRLRNLSGALQTLAVSIQSGNPLMPYVYLYDSFNHITRELHQLTAYLQQHHSFLDSAHVYPLPSFPGVEHEALLGQLLRRKLDPGVVSWIEGSANGAESKQESQASSDGADKLTRTERRQLWASAGETSARILGEMPKGLDYTLSELVNGVENVETGLKRELRTGEEKIIYDDEDSGDEHAPGMLLEDIMRFMSRGEVPRGVGIGHLQ